MLTDHKRISIRKHLPEVVEVQDHILNDVVQVSTFRLRLTDGSELAIVEQHGQTKAYHSRLRDDYSETVDALPIDPNLRERLILVFGPMTFRDQQ